MKLTKKDKELLRSWGCSSEDAKKRFNETCDQMREYMKHERPEGFASLWRLYQEWKHRCKIYDIKVSDTSDIEEYAQKEHIERFNFQ